METVFRDKEVAERIQREKVISRELVVWREYAEKYRVLVMQYLFLQEEMRRLGIKIGVRSLKDGDIEAYPEIPLFRLWNLDDARAYLEGLSPGRLKYVVDTIDYILKANYVYNSLCSWVWEAERKLKKLSR